jgi:hypothetical protein
MAKGVIEETRVELLDRGSPQTRLDFVVLMVRKIASHTAAVFAGAVFWRHPSGKPKKGNSSTETPKPKPEARPEPVVAPPSGVAAAVGAGIASGIMKHPNSPDAVAYAVDKVMTHPNLPDLVNKTVDQVLQDPNAREVVVEGIARGVNRSIENAAGAAKEAVESSAASVKEVVVSVVKKR